MRRPTDEPKARTSAMRPRCADEPIGPASAAAPTHPARGRASTFVATVVAGAVLLAVLGAPAAQARWGREHCSYEAHCYGLSGRNIESYGGVLASIDYVDTTPIVYEGIQTPNADWGQGFIDEEQWISWPKKPGEWIETGQANGYPYGCCEEHPFYAEDLQGKYKEYLSPGTEPLNTYNHYVLFDASHNGVWHIYWGCCEVGYYGGGWPVYLMQQEAGIEAVTPEQPYNWGKQEVAASDGGEWTPWSGAGWSHDPGICITTNADSSAAGNIQWSTQPGC
jgi:hypothetical protein